MHTILRSGAGALSGAAAWFSLGVLAHTAETGRVSPIGLLPPIWALGLLCAMGIAGAVRIRGLSAGLLVLPSVAILPWLGVRWPGALLWTGPGALLIWALVLAGVFRSAAWPRLSERAQLTIAAASAAACVSAFAWLTAPAGITGDEPHYLLIANSVVGDGDVDLANDYDPARHRDFYAGALEPRHVILTPAGKEYSFHGPGIAFVVLPGFAVAGLTGARIVMISVTALGIVAIWRAVRALTPSTAGAWAAVFALLLQLPFLAQGAAIYPDGAGAAITSMALLTLVRLETTRGVSTAWLAGSGAALSLLPWLHIRLSLLAMVFGAALAAAVWRRERRMTPILTLFAVPIVSAFAFFVSTLVMFETIDPTAPFRQKATGSLAGAPSGALGLLVDHEYGLLVYAPVMAFAMLGVIPTARRAPATAWSSAAAVAGTWLMAASFVWWAGTSAPARFLVPVLPAMALWIGVAWPSWSVAMRQAGIASIAIGAVPAMLAAWAERGLYATTSPDGRLSIFEWMNALVSVPGSMPSWFRPGASVVQETFVAGVWALSGLALLWVGVRIAARAPSAGWSTIAACVVAWLTTAASAGWMIRGINPHTPDRAQLELLQTSARPWLQTGWLETGPFAARNDVLRRIAVAVRPERDPRALLHVPRVPAGRYQIEVLNAAPAPAGADLALEVGRDAWPLATWTAGAPDRSPGLTLVLPVHSVRVTTTHPEVGPQMQVRLRALGGDVPRARIAETAERVTRYGPLMVYSLDRATVMQTGEFWLSGDRRGRVVIARDDGESPPIAMTLEAGPSPVDVVLTRGDWRETLSLKPGQREPARLPPSTHPAPLSIEVRGGDRRAPAVSISVKEDHER